MREYFISITPPTTQFGYKIDKNKRMIDKKQKLSVSARHE